MIFAVGATLLLFGILGFAFVGAHVMCAKDERHRKPLANDEACSAALRSLRDNPGEWTGISDNPYTQLDGGDFMFEIRHKQTGLTIWICNGIGFFDFYRPHPAYIPWRWKLPMYLAYARNKHRMEKSAPKSVDVPAIHS